MFRAIMWFFIILFVYRLIKSITIVRYKGQPPMPPPYNPPGQRPGPMPSQPAGKSTPPSNLGSIQDAEFEELPPDPPVK